MAGSQPVNEITLDPVKTSSKKRARGNEMDLDKILRGDDDGHAAQGQSSDDESGPHIPRRKSSRTLKNVDTNGMGSEQVPPRGSEAPGQLPNAFEAVNPQGAVEGASASASTPYKAPTPRMQAPPSAVDRPTLPPLRQVTAQAWPGAAAAAPTFIPAGSAHSTAAGAQDTNSHIFALRAQICDNIQVLAPYVLRAHGHPSSGPLSIHIVTLKNGAGEWMAVWLFGPSWVVYEGGAAWTVFGALENLLELVSVNLFIALGREGQLHRIGD